MNQFQIDQLRIVLTEACDAHIANGGQIISGHFYGAGNRCCPVGCVHKKNSSLSLAEALAEASGLVIDENRLWSFVDGFDDRDGVGQDTDLLALGRELRQKYLPVSNKE